MGISAQVRRKFIGLFELGDESIEPGLIIPLQFALSCGWRGHGGVATLVVFLLGSCLALAEMGETSACCDHVLEEVRIRTE